MSNKLASTISRDRSAAFCRKWEITQFSLFGSVLREDVRPDSDIDVLVSFSPGARHGLVDLMQMEEELRAIFGRKVDLVQRRLIEESDNYTGASIFWSRQRCCILLT